MEAAHISGRKPRTLPGKVLVGGIVAVSALSLGVAVGLPAQQIVFPSSADRATLTTLEEVQAPDGLDGLTWRSFEGFEVGVGAVQSQGRSMVVPYTVRLGAGAGDSFTDMLGIPHIVRPDGSFVLPSEYGAAKSESGAGARPGLSSGAASAAIFDGAAVVPGSTIRFGPFFKTLPEGAVISASGAELQAGLRVSLGGEPFLVTASALGEGLTEITFKALAEAPRIVATHPVSRATVTVDGKKLVEIKGSTNFAKTEALDVNANTSALVMEGRIEASARVEISLDRLGLVVKGAWDFPLE